MNSKIQSAGEGPSSPYDTDLVPDEFVSYDNRNENQNKTVSATSDISDRNQEQDPKLPIMQTCTRCGDKVDSEAFYMKLHHCEGTD